MPSPHNMINLDVQSFKESTSNSSLLLPAYTELAAKDDKRLSHPLFTSRMNKISFICENAKICDTGLGIGLLCPINNFARYPQGNGLMITTIYKKIITRQIIAGFLFLAFLLVYDVILDILLSGLHVIYEIIEWSAGELVQYLFQTNHHQSEIIVIYVFFFIFLYALYRLLHALPRLSRRLKRRVSLRWARKKIRFTRYWHTFSSFQKVKLLSVYGVSISLIIIWLFFL